MTIYNSSSNLDGEPSQQVLYSWADFRDLEPELGLSPLASLPRWPSTSRFLARSLHLLAASLRVIFCVSLMSFGLLAQVADLGSYISIRSGQVAMARTL